MNELLLAKFWSRSIPDATRQYYSEYFKLLAVCYAGANPRDIVYLRTRGDASEKAAMPLRMALFDEVLMSLGMAAHA